MLIVPKVISISLRKLNPGTLSLTELNFFINMINVDLFPKFSGFQLNDLHTFNGVHFFSTTPISSASSAALNADSISLYAIARFSLDLAHSMKKLRAAMLILLG